MFPALPENIQDELTYLMQRYGQPIIRNVELTAKENFDPLTKTDRYGEVCMVIRRKNGRLLTSIKSFYPAGAYRLLTGGINHGEHIFDALLRETMEETGLEVEVKRFLAIAIYTVTYQDGTTNQTTKQTPNFYTFAFLLDEVSGALDPIDKEEQVEDFREIEPMQLPELAAHLENLGTNESEEIRGRWKDWGHFRAVIHHLVWEALQES